MTKNIKIMIGFILLAVIVTVLAITLRQTNKKIVASQNEHITQLTESNFQSETSQGIVVIDFWASWCMPCKMMSPIVDEVAKELPAGYKVCKLDVDQAQNIAAQFQIMSIPTILILKDGKEVNRQLGATDKMSLKNFILQVK
jgi:thioredoxin 1